MVKVYMRTLSWMHERIKNRDIFSQSISLTYKGKESISNFIGGCWTIAFCLVLTIFGIFLLNRMIEKKEVSWDKNEKKVSLQSYEKNVSLETGFQTEIMFHFTLDQYAETHEDYEEFSGSLSNYFFVVVRLGRLLNHEFIDHLTYKLADCGPEWDEIKELDSSITKQTDGIDLGFAWINLNSVYLIGNSMHPNFTELNIIISAWGPVNAEENDNWLPGNANFVYQYYLKLDTFLMTQHVDLDDVDSPIKTHMTTWLTPGAVERDFYQYEIFVVQTEVYLDDNYWLPYSNPDPIRFATLEEPLLISKTNLGDDNVGMFFFKMHLSNKYVQYKRRVLSFFEVTGIIGGLFEIFEVGIGLILGLYTSFVFKKDLKTELRLCNDRYLEIKRTLEALQEAQKSYTNQNNAHNPPKEADQPYEEIKEMHKNRNKEKIISNRYFDKKISKEHEFRKINLSMPALGLNEHNKDDSYSMEHFRNDLDWVKLSFRLKILEKKVQFLMESNPCYAEVLLKSKPPAFNDPEMQPMIRRKSQNFRSNTNRIAPLEVQKHRNYESRINHQDVSYPIRKPTMSGNKRYLSYLESQRNSRY